MAVPNKVELFKVIAKAEQGERIPRVPGAWHFALPFLADSAVDWSLWFDGKEEPRAILVSRYPHFKADGTTVEPKEGKIYPTDISVTYDVDNFLGIIIDGVNYTRDLNFTVTLAAGIPEIYLQSDYSNPTGVVDQDIKDIADDLGLKYFNGQVFWNKVQ